MDYTTEFSDAIASAGLTPPDRVIGDGKIHRFSSNGRSKDDAGWYIFHDDEHPAGRFGCNRSGVDCTWSSKSKRSFTPEQKAEWARKMREREAEREAEIKEEREKAAETAADIWNSAKPANGHAYLKRKQIVGIGARELDGELLIPMKHGKGEIVGLQRIKPDGDKRFLKGTPAGGAYHVIGKPVGTLIICEGYATGVSIHQATGKCVVVAFNAGNLLPVAKKIRAAMPSISIIVAADDDAFTDGNPGRTAANEAANAVGGWITYPMWAGDRERGTDFNDLHVSEGLGAVSMCFEDPQPPEEDDHGFDMEPSTIDMATGEIVPSASLSPVQHAVNGYAPEYSDSDLAIRFVSGASGDVLWCETWGRWMIWQGNRWVRDETLLVGDMVRQSCMSTATELLGRMDSDAGEKQRIRQANQLSSYRTIQAVDKLARMDRRAATHPGEWDSDLWLLNTPDCVVDLRDGSRRPHRREDKITKSTSVSPSGDCPTWKSFLDVATNGDKTLQLFLQRMCGYVLTGVVREHALFFVYGTGGNGKGTFLNTVTAIMADYQQVSSAETFTEQKGDRHLTELARLVGARLVSAQETEEGKRWAESRIKSLTGGDPITANFMRQDHFTFIPQFKLVIAGNHKPAFRAVDEAIRRRLHLIPFNVSIPAEKRDPFLSEKLKAEASGILQWMIEGCLMWQREGLNPPAIVKDHTDCYLGDEDTIAQWMEECCEVDKYAFSASADLFRSWSEWCEGSGEFVGTKKRLTSKLEGRGFSTDREGGKRGVKGIRICYSTSENVSHASYVSRYGR